MKHLTGTYNKTTTIIESEVVIENDEIKHKNYKMFSFKTKKGFFNWVNTQEAITIRISQNAKGFIKTMQSLGFVVDTNNEGCFDWELNAYCSK